jgi:hypothetical protein
MRFFNLSNPSTLRQNIFIGLLIFIIIALASAALGLGIAMTKHTASDSEKIGNGTVGAVERTQMITPLP